MIFTTEINIKNLPKDNDFLRAAVQPKQSLLHYFLVLPTVSCFEIIFIKAQAHRL